MKKTLLAVALLLPTLALGEIQAGTVELRGSSTAGFQRVTTTVRGMNSSSSTGVALSTGALYYLTPHLGLGAEVFAGYDRSSGDVGSLKVTQLGLAPKLGLDLPLTPTASLFGEALAGMEWLEVTDGDLSNSTNAFAWGLGGGVKLFPIAALSVDLGLRYRWVQYKASSLVPTETHTALSFMIGLSGYFGGH
jgi:opacity protein-like surface antigen